MKGVDRWSKQITKSLDELTKATFPNFSQVIAHRDRYRKWTKCCWPRNSSHAGHLWLPQGL